MALTISFMGIQGAYSADFALFLNSNLAGLTGVTLALIWTLVTRPFGAGLALRRLVRATWRDLALFAAGKHREDYAQLTARLRDRLDLLLPRLSAGEGMTLNDGYRDLRIGFAILHLQQEEQELPEDMAQAIGEVLEAVARHFRGGALQRRYEPPEQSLLKKIDHGLRCALATPTQAAMEVCNGLVELRIALYPEAPALDLAPDMTQAGADDRHV
ncbi:Fusaric acid resistance protein family protein [compost metagenome]